ncbi:MAG: UDP-N-acetylmuramate dehydrogenase [Herminiimonas sp.]|nr:UDP-N-acetylmuramate dehydrogenase [Herminiimonas sp.]
MQTDLPIRHNFSLRQFNTFGIDAAAHAFLDVTDSDMLQQVRADQALAALPRLILGGGSNIVLTRDFPGLVLHVATRGIAIVGQDAQRTLVRAAAGESWHGLVQWTLAQGLGGMENLSLIPGSVGASPIQNIGAYGVEVGDLIDTVRYHDMDTGEIVTLDRDGCEFGYRDSVFKHRLRDRAVILDVTFALPVHWRANLGYAELQQELEKVAARDTTGDSSTGAATDAATAATTGAAATTPATVSAAAISAAVIAIRTRKLPDPARVGNAGSFFKNPLVSAAKRNALLATLPGLVSHVQPDGAYKLAAGWLIDQCGWKGRSLGAAGVYEKQALVLVNRGNATGAEIMALAAAIRADVNARFGVLLEPEPVCI